MKNWLFVVIIILLAVIGAEYAQVNYANGEWESAEANVKAYDLELSTSEKKNTALQLTVNQLNCFKDSVLVELNETRKELRIKDKNLKSLQKVSSVFSRADTIMLKDTVFSSPSLAVDTVMGDEWCSVELGLRYPSMIAVKPLFRSEKHIVVSTRRETVNPPKKFFLLRWFQRKHKVLQVEVVERNPYVEDVSSRYVEIIK